MHRLLPLLLVAVTAAACGGSDSKPDAADGPKEKAAEPQRTLVTMGSAMGSVVYGRSDRLEGVVDGDAREVSLHADEHPYDKPRVVRRLKVDDDGRFRTRVRPERDTRYWAVVGGAAPGRSRAARVFVTLKSRFQLQETTASTGRGVITWAARGQTLERTPGARACLYRLVRGSTYRRVRCDAVKRASGGRLVASIPYSGASAGQKYSMCPPRGVAAGYRRDYLAGCGERTLVKASR